MNTFSKKILTAPSISFFIAFIALAMFAVPATPAYALANNLHGDPGGGPVEVQFITASISASPNPTTYGGSSTLTWSSTGAAKCIGTNFSTGNATAGSVNVTPGSSTTYTVTCTANNGASPDTESVTVSSGTPPPPTVSFSASPTTINQGNSSALTWSCTNSYAAYILNVGWVSVSGSANVTPSSATSYTLTCFGNDGTFPTASATVNVNGLPVASLSASPSSVTTGNSSGLTYRCTNSTSGSITSLGSITADGSAYTVSVVPANTATYTLTCSGSAGNATASATVAVTAPPSGGNNSGGTPGAPGSGVVIYNSPNSISDFQYSGFNGHTGVYVSAVKADMMSNGPAGWPNYCLSRWAFPQTVACNTSSFGGSSGNKFPDGYYIKDNRNGFYGPPTTANRMCKIADQVDAQAHGFQPDTNVSATYVAAYKYGGNNDENTSTFDGSKWYVNESAPSFYIPSFVGLSQGIPGDINDSVNGLTCASFDLPKQTLAASATSITAGQPVTLTWADTAYSDNLEPSVTSCTTSGFNLGTTQGTPYCDDWEVSYEGDCGNQAAAALALAGNCHSTRYCAHYSTPTITSLSGSTTVSPTQTTTYTYNCTNANGTTNRSVTVNVASACTPNSGQTCTATSPANACGTTRSNTGTYSCTGVCSVSAPTAPALPAGYGNACTSAANSCGQTNSGTINCSGACSASAPATPANLGQACVSTANSCGMTQSNGTWQCNGSCSSTPPSNSLCNQPPSAPTLWGLYDNSTATYYGATAPGYHSVGYAMYANATDPNGDNVNYLMYFYNTQTGAYTTVQWTGWTASGSWNYVTALNSLPQGTYWVGAYAQDTGGAQSAFSGWASVVLTGNVAASCSVAPTTGTTATTYQWHATASGGSGTGYTYAWSGTGLTGKTGTPVAVTYGSGGTFPGSVTATDSAGNSSGTVACTAGGGGDPTGGPSTTVAALPAASLSPSIQTITTGQKASFTWTSTNATSCVDVASPPAFDNGPTSGTNVQTTNALNASQTFQLRCTGPGGTGLSNQATVNVLQPSAYITASPLRVGSSGSTVISWSAADVTACTVSGSNGYAWSRALTPPATTIATTSSPSQTIANQTKFTIDCTTGVGPDAISSVIVNVLPGFQEF